MDFIRYLIKTESDKFVLETSEERLVDYERTLCFLKKYRKIIVGSICKELDGASGDSIRTALHESTVYQSVNELINAVILIEDNYCQQRLDSQSETLLASDFDFDYVKESLNRLGFNFVLDYGFMVRDSYNHEVHEHPYDCSVSVDISDLPFDRYLVHHFISYLIESNIGDNVHHVALDMRSDVTLYELSLILKYDSDFVDFLYEFCEYSDKVKSKIERR